MANSAKKLLRSKGRKESGSFLAIPHAVLRSPNFIALSSSGVKLLIDLATEYKGTNNGDLCATWSMMKKRGWKSQDTLNRALRELISRGMIVKTRQGGLNYASLYALSWRRIDECGGKLDISSTIAPPGNWRFTELNEVA